MGNDGGSIPYRIDLVKTAAKKEVRDEKAALRDLWFFCALSKRLLEAPIVTDPLGKLYNKDALIEFLLDREGSSYGDGDQICGYVKGVKDIVNLNPTPNPSHISSSSSANSRSHNAKTNSGGSDNDDMAHHPFVCPLTMREMSGSVPFVAMRGCGCVLSEGGLKGVILAEESNASPSGSGSGSAEEAEHTVDGVLGSEEKMKGKEVSCPNCSKLFSLPIYAISLLSSSSPANSTSERKDPTLEQLRHLPWIPLNSKIAIQDLLLENLVIEKAIAKIAKASKAENKKKRKATGANLGDDLTDVGPPKNKKAASATSNVHVQMATSTLSSRVTAELAQLEAQRQAKAAGQGPEGVSAAVRSMYTAKETGKQTSRDQFFRTFNRYA